MLLQSPAKLECQVSEAQLHYCKPCGPCTILFTMVPIGERSIRQIPSLQLPRNWKLPVGRVEAIGHDEIGGSEERRVASSIEGPGSRVQGPDSMYSESKNVVMLLHLFTLPFRACSYGFWTIDYGLNCWRIAGEMRSSRSPWQLRSVASVVLPSKWEGAAEPQSRGTEAQQPRQHGLAPLIASLGCMRRVTEHGYLLLLSDPHGLRFKSCFM